MAVGSRHAALGRKQTAPPGRAHLSAAFPKGRADLVMTLRLFRSKPPRLSPDLDRQERQGLGLRQPLAQSQARPPGETLPLLGPQERVLGCGGTWREQGLWANRPQGPQAEPFPSLGPRALQGLSARGRVLEPKAALDPLHPVTAPGQRETPATRPESSGFRP